MSRTSWILLALSLIGCGDNTLAPDAHPMDADDESDSMEESPFTTLATFDPARMEQPEGVATAGGITYVGLASLGQIVKIQTPGMVEAFGTLPAPVSNTYTLGLAVNTTGDVLVGVGASGVNPMPPPGIYKIPAAGGTAEVFSTATGMNFPNAIDLDRGKIYVTDSAGGRIYEISPTTGNATVWLDDPLLDGDTAACNGTGVTFAIGANGIAHDATNRYVAVTDFGRIVRVPIMGNGNAGTPVVLAESCTNLQGIDGIALEAGGTIVAVRNGPSNTMVRVSADGQTVTPIHVGAPLDGPASVTIETGTTPRLILTNSAFFSGTAGKPSVLARNL